MVLLAEGPMHGYQIMQELQDRSGGAWQPSPGSIYPTLQLMADEGLVSGGDDDGGRKIFTLTEAGHGVKDEMEEPPPWEVFAGEDKFVDMRQTVGSVVAAAKQVGQVGSPDQVAAAAEILADTRQRLYKLLAE